MIRLYVVVARKLAESIKRQQAFPEYGKYYALEATGKICGVPSPHFSDLSWHEVEDFDPDALPRDWEELSIAFPEQEIYGYEYTGPEGGNRVWSIPPKVATHFLKLQCSDSSGKNAN